MRTAVAQDVHSELVKYAVGRLHNLGYSPIYADLPGRSQPSNISGYIPDVTGYARGKLLVIAEAETGETIGTAHSDAQWTAFSNEAVRIGAKFVVVVPQGYEDAAGRRLRALGLQGVVW